MQDGPRPASGHPPDALDDSELLAVVETPRGAAHKLKFDEQLGTFRLSRVLPVGMVFPCDFGYVPGTRAADGDPIDVMLLLGTALPTGVAVRARVVAVIQMLQRDVGEWRRNDRLIAVPIDDPRQARIRGKQDLDHRFLDELEGFLVAMAEADDVEVRVVGRKGRRAAERALGRARRNDLLPETNHGFQAIGLIDAPTPHDGALPVDAAQSDG